MLPDEDLVTEENIACGMPEPAPSPPPQPTRQRAVAQVRPISMLQVVREMAGRDPIETVRDLDTTSMDAPQIHQNECMLLS